MGGGPDRDGPAVQTKVRGVQPGEDGSVCAEERHLPSDAVPRTPRTPGLTQATRQEPCSPPGPSLPQPAHQAPRYASRAPVPTLLVKRSHQVREVTSKRPHYGKRLWAELGRMGGEHDAFIKVIIVERIIKSIVLIALAIGLLVAGRTGLLTQWADYAKDQL